MSVFSERDRKAAEHRKEATARQIAFVNLLVSELKAMPQTNGEVSGTHRIIKIGSEFVSSFTIDAQCGGRPYYIPSGKLTIKFSDGLSRGRFGYAKAKSYPEPKAGYDPKLWAERIVNEYQAWILKRECEAEQDKEKCRLDAAADRVGGDVKANGDGLIFARSRLTEEQAIRFVALAKEMGI